jgi:phage-related protein
MLSGIYYYMDLGGRRPVKEFISSLPVKDRAKVFAYFNELKVQGHNMRRPMADYLRDGIYELRPKHNRIFYFFYMKDKVVLVHAIRKFILKIPEQDLELCIKRKKALEVYGLAIENIDQKGAI